jgi:hypothetical protein
MQIFIKNIWYEVPAEVADWLNAQNAEIGRLVEQYRQLKDKTAAMRLSQRKYLSTKNPAHLPEIRLNEAAVDGIIWPKPAKQLKDKRRMERLLFL